MHIAPTTYQIQHYALTFDVTEVKNSYLRQIVLSSHVLLYCTIHRNYQIPFQANVDLLWLTAFCAVSRGPNRCSPVIIRRREPGAGFPLTIPPKPLQKPPDRPAPTSILPLISFTTRNYYLAACTVVLDSINSRLVLAYCCGECVCSL
jgi:hypothetical protein